MCIFWMVVQCIFNAWILIFYPVASDLVMEYSQDDNIARASVDTYGTKSFAFHFSPWNNTDANRHAYKQGIVPYMHSWDDTRENLMNDDLYGCSSGTHGRVFCTKLIQLNNWKIPDDYPHKF